MKLGSFKGIFVYMLIAVGMLAVFVTVFSPSFSASSEIPVSQMISLANSGKLKSIDVSGDNLSAEGFDGQNYTSRKEPGSSIVEQLNDSGSTSVDISVRGNSGFGSFLGILFNLLPILFFGGLLIFMMRQAQGNSSQTFSFGKSKAKKYDSDNPEVSFSDVAGVDEAKEELQEVVEFLKSPQKFIELGAKIPRGVLLMGPPGVGKTLMARAVAGEAGVPFFSISGSEFVEMFVGVGASRVRDLFDQAKKNSPCIVFIDEIDAVGRQRGAGLGGGHDEREQTLNQILVEMDGFDTGANVIVLASTNRPDILDPALLRPGRFDRRVTLDNPDVKGRQQILSVHAKGKPIDEDIDLEAVAKQTSGFSGADLMNLLNEAAILSARRDKKKIVYEEIAESIDRVIAGPEKKNKNITEKEKQMVAYHEAGHALVAHLLPYADPPFKVTIVARGQTGGHTRFLPEEETSLVTQNQLEARLAAALGGRVAEEIMFYEVTTGAGNDLEQATNIARAMITRLGMSKKLGPRTFGKREELVFLGREISEQRDYSDTIAETIDDEVHSLVQTAYEVAKSLLNENLGKLSALAKYLVEHESVEGEELTNLLNSAPASITN
ncbi:MAG: cell division protein FtsH [Chloroflexi bacterium]|nr:cell division protein FtsH [Chloroflexota bacterium]|tara:strand:- start:9622 stop:11442 length:1821 start_codon:yes stop_codon:yes gene_type:complete